MSQNFFQTVQQQAEIALTYLLTLVDGTEHWLVPVDALNGVVMDDPNDRGIMTGRLLGGGSIQVPIDHIFMVEEKRYRVEVNNGQGRTSRDVSERDLERTIREAPRDKDTGEVKVSWNSIKDRKTGDKIDLD